MLSWQRVDSGRIGVAVLQADYDEVSSRTDASHGFTWWQRTGAL